MRSWPKRKNNKNNEALHTEVLLSEIAVDSGCTQKERRILTRGRIKHEIKTPSEFKKNNSSDIIIE